MDGLPGYVDEIPHRSGCLVIELDRPRGLISPRFEGTLLEYSVIVMPQSYIFGPANPVHACVLRE